MLTDDKYNFLKIEEVATYFNALSNPYRLMILKKIASENECITSDLQIDLPIKRTTIIQHLQELKKVGLLRGNVKGKKLYYCIDYERLNEIREILCDAIALPIPEFSCCLDIIQPESLLPRKT